MDNLSFGSKQDRSLNSTLEKKQHHFDKAISDEGMVSGECTKEHYQPQYELREKETKLLSISHKCDERKQNVRKKLILFMILVRLVLFFTFLTF